MKSVQIIFFLTCFVYIYSGCKGQKPFGENFLVEQTTIAMPGIKGRIDHLDVNLKEKIVFVAALGNNSLEIVDIVKKKVLHSIKGLDEPQGVHIYHSSRKFLWPMAVMGIVIFIMPIVLRKPQPYVFLRMLTMFVTIQQTKEFMLVMVKVA